MSGLVVSILFQRGTAGVAALDLEEHNGANTYFSSKRWPSPNNSGWTAAVLPLQMELDQHSPLLDAFVIIRLVRLRGAHHSLRRAWENDRIVHCFTIIGYVIHTCGVCL